MNSITTTTLQELENSINKIFECDQKIGELELEEAAVKAERKLLNHMMKAFQLIDRGTD